MFVSNIIPVEDVLIRPEITEIEFACDLSKCKGACCTVESEFGAPLLEEEITKIEEILSEVKEYLPKRHVEEIDKRGFYEEKNGELLTNSVNNKACVFVYYEGDIAKCAIEKLYLENKTDFKKPISCHLFPIRVSDFGGDLLRYEKFSDCEPALKNGKENKIKLVDFLSESLSRLYGKEWYSKLVKLVK